jgi:methyl-accepting chemotaxis protein-1 (serine sensor receptor)
MKLKLKLPLVFSAAMALMLAAALFAIYTLNRSVTTFDTEVSRYVDNRRAVKDVAITFKGQVQEWKDVLLRGKDPAMLDKYWSAFQAKERKVNEMSQALIGRLPEGDSKRLMQQFAAAHAKMGEDYRKGFEAFKQADFLHSAGDAAVKGMDRPPAQLLDQAAEAIGKDANAIAAQASADAKGAVSLCLTLMAVVSVIGIVGAIVVSRRIVRPLDEAVEVARSVASGDLTVAVHAKGQDETAELLRALHEMQQKLATLVRVVREDAESVATASAEIAQGNLHLSSRTEEQASALQQTAASMEELGAVSKQNADNAQQATQLAAGACDVAAKGAEVVHAVVETMNGIHEGSRRISEIIGVIDGISFQTNILALNAAVEAARAGEQGRGFAVVAAEVRALAQRSATAAKEIKTLINDSVGRVEHGSELVSRAGQTMSEVAGAIKRVTDVIGEISAATHEQNSGVGQINDAVAQMDQATQQNAALVEQCSATAESLRVQSDHLVKSVSAFRLAMA